ncbi:hypothetical protein EGY25_04275 [Brevundimonas intermedia]|uniref:DUF2570 domain-containing protein n=1 Tax=Brevundimonas intermedia TaxID=74315 RepID=A0A4Y9S3E4_9CAUL|nr:hypothetical protein [Brevundimonas intermedia]TFW14415.1 hypothetical protein EGY25_04275 [Brevundimonas intermedia]
MIALAFIRRIPGMLSPKGWIAVALLAAFLLFGAYCAHRAAQGERDHQASVTAKTEAMASSARETAAGERATDTIIINAREKELSDAVNSLPDARPSARRVRLACERLRQQGNTSLPAECGPGG